MAGYINSELQKLTGKPLCVSKGETTRAVSVSGPGDLGMGPFNPLKGANPNGNYIVNGVEAYGSSPGMAPTRGRSQR